MADTDKMQNVRKQPSAWANVAKSPREIGRAKTAAVCKWIYRWGFTSAEVINIIGRSKFTGLPAKLVKNGVLKKTLTPSGGYLAGHAQYMYTLTEQGLQIAQQVDEDTDLDYQLDPHKRSLVNFRHDLICQLHVVGYYHFPHVLIEPESMVKTKSVAEKQADCLLRYPTQDGNQNFRHAIEVELTKKHGRTLHEFVMKVFFALNPVPDPAEIAAFERLKAQEMKNVQDYGYSDYYIDTNARDPYGAKNFIWDWSTYQPKKTAKKGVLWDVVDIISDIKGVKTDYSALLKENAVIKAWKRDKLKWVEDPKKSILVTKEMADMFSKRVKFKTLNDKLTAS